MHLGLDHIGQIALAVADVDRAEAFYEKALGLRKLYRFGDLTLFRLRGRARADAGGAEGVCAADRLRA